MYHINLLAFQFPIHLWFFFLNFRYVPHFRVLMFNYHLLMRQFRFTSVHSNPNSLTCLTPCLLLFTSQPPRLSHLRSSSIPRSLRAHACCRRDCVAATRCRHLSHEALETQVSQLGGATASSGLHHVWWRPLANFKVGHACVVHQKYCGVDVIKWHYISQ